MQDTLGVAVVKPANELLENTLGNILLELSTLSHIVQKVSSSSDLNHKKDVLLSLKVLKETYNVLMARLLEYDDFLKDLLTLGVFAKVLFIYAFDCYHLLSQIMQSQIYFTKGSFAKNLSNSVKVHSCHRHLTTILET